MSESKAKLEELNKKTAELKKAIAEMSAQKEAWFQNKRKLSQSIQKDISQIKESRDKRNKFTKAVHTEKNERNKLNNEIKSKIEDLKELQKKKDALGKIDNPKISPAKIKKEIEDLELKIETEALPFSIEKKFMKQIAEKRKILGGFKDVSGVFDNLRKLQKDVRVLKKEADAKHKEIQIKAVESQEHHESLINLSKNIDNSKTEEENALKNFVEWKAKHSEKLKELKELQKEIKEIRKGLGEEVEEERHKKKQEVKELLKEKSIDIEEKIKTGKKLTTEDILIFQAQSQVDKMKTKKTKKKIANVELKEASPVKTKEE